MKHFFMQAIDMQKHNILKAILLNEHGIGAKYIMDKFDISSTSTHRFIHAINHDLSLAFPNEELAIVLQNNHYSIESSKSHQKAFVLDTLQVHYVIHSIEYNIINSILIKKYMSVSQLALELNISSSQLYKYLKSIRKMLQMFHLKIEFNNHKKNSNLVGNEIHIQFFLCQLYWNLFKGLNWPFKNTLFQNETDDLKKFSHLLPSQVARIQYIRTISEFIASKRKHPLELDTEFIEMMLLFENDSDYSSNPFFINKHYFHPNEKHLYHFLLRYFIADLDTDEKKILISKHTLKQNSKLSVMTQQLLNHMLEQFSIQLPESTYYVYYYYLIITLLQLKYVDAHYQSFYQEEENFLAESLSAKAELAAIEDALTQFFSILEKTTLATYFGDVTKNSIEYLVFFFHPLLTLQTQKKTEISICLHISKKFYFNYIIKQQLFSMFGKENIIFTREIATADLIISDSLQEDSSVTNFFFFDNIYDHDSWKSLLLFITTLLQKKKFSFNHQNCYPTVIEIDSSKMHMF